jgi:large subunit ribosomal protein L25
MATQAPQITAKPRSELGSRANKRLRDSGQLPGVIYGHKEAVVPVTLPKKEVENHLSHRAHLFDLAIDGKSEKVLVKEVQYDHLGLHVIHVDFARVSLDERVEVTVPIELKGEPKEEEEGVITQVINELEIECLVTEIPTSIKVNIADMKLDDQIAIKDLVLPPGVTTKIDPEAVVVTLKEVKEEEIAPVAEAESAEPELIGRKPEEGEAPAEGAAAPAAEKKE